ncbi:MAG: pseudouridine synthase [Frankiales bacterium]|nr:pseudouridine synthase [Frankiales bacterium]
MKSESAAEPARLQKVLAAAGVGSRRACEQLIEQRRVTVEQPDGQQVVAELGQRVDPATATVRVDGKRINLRSELRYVAFNKPIGVVSAMTDPHGRPTLTDYLADDEVRLFHVGRLDIDTEGLLLLTNDGDFAQHLAHPSHEVSKTYVAEVDGILDSAVLRSLKAGVELEDGLSSIDSGRILDTGQTRSLVELTLHSGRNRVVRRTLAAVGHPVQRLVRTAIGPVRLGDQRPGTLRELTGTELGELYRQLET